MYAKYYALSPYCYWVKDLNPETEPKSTAPWKVDHCQIWMVGYRWIDLARSTYWPSIISLALIHVVAEKWTKMQKLNLNIIRHWTMKYRSLSDMDGWFQMVSSRNKCWPSIISLSPYSCWEMDLNTKTEPKSPYTLMLTCTFTSSGHPKTGWVATPKNVPTCLRTSLVLCSSYSS